VYSWQEFESSRPSKNDGVERAFLRGPSFFALPFHGQCLTLGACDGKAVQSGSGMCQSQRDCATERRT
jgi:hypothetical protein